MDFKSFFSKSNFRNRVLDEGTLRYVSVVQLEPSQVFLGTYAVFEKVSQKTVNQNVIRDISLKPRIYYWITLA